MATVDMEAVGAILREAAETIIVPRFQSLADDEVEEKSPGETVTVADRESEAFISSRLEALLPGVPVVGEEAVEDDPGLRSAIGSAPQAWLVDPLDGTSAFTRGEPEWAVMAALVRRGETVCSWILHPMTGHLYQAERGSGAWCGDGRLTSAPRDAEAGRLRGAVLTRFLTEEERLRMEPRFGTFKTVHAGYPSAGMTYPAVIAGDEDFAIYQRLLPWDHAPGVLLVNEAGGLAQHPGGEAYRPDRPMRGMIVAANPAAWEIVREVLYGNGDPDEAPVRTNAATGH